ncbi:hypothetical protein [Pseudomonas sp. KCJK9009]|uniref:hypothetical protein n=1 Tax=Pseudomonas sp. KCJK9009 TaxID=3344561 RepID=UPI003905F91F
MKIKSMLNISLEAANTIHTSASLIAITCALIASIAGVVTYMASTVQSRYNDQAIANANSVSAQARNAAAQAELKTEEVTKANLELSIKLETEKLKRLKIEENLMPRTFSTQVTKAFTSNLKGLDGKPVVIINIAKSEDEVTRLAGSLSDILKDAGAHVVITKVHVISMGSNTGIKAMLYDGFGNKQIELAIQESGIASKISRYYPKPNRLPPRFDTSQVAAEISIFTKDLVMTASPQR